MDTQIKTIPIPPKLYEKVRKAQAAGLITDFVEFAHQLINERLDQLFLEDWQQGLRELRESVRASRQWGTTEEIVEEMRRIREQVWDEEYADYYRQQ